MFLFHLLNPGEVTDGVVTVFVKIIAGGILCKTAANLCWSEARNQAINESALVWKPHKNVRWLFSIWCSNIGFERCHFSATHGVRCPLLLAPGHTITLHGHSRVTNEHFHYTEWNLPCHFVTFVTRGNRSRPMKDNNSVSRADWAKTCFKTFISYNYVKQCNRLDTFGRISVITIFYAHIVTMCLCLVSTYWLPMTKEH